MAIQQLPADPSALSRILGGLGQGLGASIPQGIESNVLQNILGKQDLTQDPQAFMQALLGAPVSTQVKQTALTAVNALGKQDTQLQQRREARLQKQDVSSNYKALIKDIQDNLKSGVLTDVQSAKTAILDLRKEQQSNLQNIDKNEPIATGAIEKYFSQFVESEQEPAVGIFERIGGFFGKKKQVESKIKEFATEFPPSQYKGRTATDPATGIQLRSDGKTWIPVKG